MPLPDERPRQSVANLIGRFENQTKRQSIVPTVPPRTSSVTSQNSSSGDVEKIEQKEKREWPPRPRPSSTATFSPSIADQLARFTDGSVAKSPPTEPVPIPEPVSDPAPATAQPAPSPPEIAIPVPKLIHKRQSSTGAINTPPPTTPSKPGRPSTAGGSTRTPTRSFTKSPPTAYHPSPSTSASTPAKAATPKPTPVRPRPSSRTSHTMPAPVKTPSRPKTPSARPKTPSHTTATPTAAARPKTPSSGLFAPTAASLARARNTQSSLPTPVKKAASNSGVMERLSKPTAASLSKARASAPVPTVAKGGPAARSATPSRGTARGAAPVARGTGVKTRGVAAPPTKGKMTTPTLKPPVVAAAVAEADPVHAEIPDEPLEEPEQYHEEPEALSSPIEAHEHDGSESTLIDEPQGASAAVVEDPSMYSAAEQAAVVFLSSKEGDLAEHGAPDTSAEEALEEVVQKPEETITQEGTHELPAAATEAEEHEETPYPEEFANAEFKCVDSSTTPEGHDVSTHVNGKTTPTPSDGVDLADIVTMLETKPRPMSIATIPDEFDISDQE